MKCQSIERELYVEATPEVVFEVVSSARHVKQWWPDDARFESAPGSVGEIVFGDPEAGGKVVAFTVVEAQSPRRFSFCWAHEPGEAAAVGNSMLVTFDLAPSGSGTLLTMRETGFLERGWDAETVEEEYQAHVRGWGAFLPRLAPYAESVLARS